MRAPLPSRLASVIAASVLLGVFIVGCDRTKKAASVPGKSSFLAKADLRKVVQSAAPPGLAFSFGHHGVSGGAGGDTRRHEAQEDYSGTFHFRSADGQDVSCTAEHLHHVMQSAESQLHAAVGAAGGRVADPKREMDGSRLRRFSFTYTVGPSTGTVIATAEPDEAPKSGALRPGRLEIKISETTVVP
jgi:hypothetical protein